MFNNFMCECVKYLHTQYPDSYTFEIEAYTGLEYDESFGKMKIFHKGTYIKEIEDSLMQNIFFQWLRPTYIQERQQYDWQKELVDLIEGS